MISVQELLPKVKTAARITTDAFDSNQLAGLITAAQMDLGIAGVIVPEEYDALVGQAIITYCLMHFGLVDDYDRLKKSYDEQKGQLMTASGYTNWIGGD